MNEVEQQARDEGYDACMNGEPVSACPYDGIKGARWFEGWSAANVERDIESAAAADDDERRYGPSDDY